MSNRYILMWFEAPLQSWGYDSKFGRRDTLNFPTKSGVLGLLCCALGAGGEQTELLKSMSELRQTVISFVRVNQRNQEKYEREPLLRDFHMVGAGYDANDPWQVLLEPHKSDGKRRTSDGGGAKMTFRYYLQDAYFAVVMEVPSDKAGIFASALKNPVWDLYLGRKNCVPTDFIYRDVFSTEDEALEKSLELAQEKKLAEDFRVYRDDGKYDGEVLILNDVPIQFGENKKYSDRRVVVVTAS